MLSRCTNPQATGFANYGGRGIRVCDRWREDFRNFLADMGERPSGTTLDRIDVNGDYTPGNCRWADRTTQNRNARQVIRVNYAGREWKLVELAEACGIPLARLHARLRSGATIEEAVAMGTPTRFKSAATRAKIGEKARARFSRRAASI